MMVTAALALAACGQRGSSVDYHANGGQTITIDDGKKGKLTAEVGATAKMPSDLPAWTPAYPGSTVLMAQRQNQASGQLENVMLQTPDDLTRVTAFYDRKIAGAGLKPMHAAGGADVSIRLVEMPSGIMSVNVAKSDEGGSTISISRLPK